MKTQKEIEAEQNIKQLENELIYWQSIRTNEVEKRENKKNVISLLSIHLGFAKECLFNFG